MSTRSWLLLAVQVVAGVAALTPGWARLVSKTPQLTPAAREPSPTIAPWQEHAASTPIPCDTCHSPVAD